MATLTLEAPAKINLFLDVKSHRTNEGYHLLDTLMVPVSLYDSLTIEIDPLEDGPMRPPVETPPIGIRFSPELSCETHASSVYKALLAMHHAFREGVFENSFRVAVDKRIPEKSGLGGGSSDAAAIILALCRLWKLDPLSAEVIEVAAKIGADVPFFLYSSVCSKESNERGAAYLQGIGEELVCTLDALNLNLVLIKAPQAQIATAEAYALFDQEHSGSKNTQQFLTAYKAAVAAPDVFSAHAVVPQNLMAPTAQELFAAMGNNLEPIAIKLDPSIEEVRRYLIAQPSVGATMLAGSGAALFGICPALKDCEDIAFDAAQKGWWAQAVSTKCTGLSLLAL